MKLTSLSALIGWGFHESALSGKGFGHAGKPAHSTHVWIRQKGTAQRFCLGEREEGTVVQNKRGEMIYKPN